MEYTVCRIDEDIDFGCEEREEDAPVMALVTLCDACGKEIVLRQPDQMLYDRKINEGDQVFLDEEKKLQKIGSENVLIRKAVIGDEKILAHIQIESWKEAFKEIIPEETLLKYTQIDRVLPIYEKVLREEKGHGYLLEIDGKPHGIAFWDASREMDRKEDAELICIHSLKENWHRGYGTMLLERVLEDAKKAGYRKIMLWVFVENKRAIRCYEKQGFVASGRKREAFGAEEEMYCKDL